MEGILNKMRQIKVDANKDDLGHEVRLVKVWSMIIQSQIFWWGQG